MCLMPGSQTANDLRASGRMAARSSIAPPSRPSTPTMHHGRAVAVSLLDRDSDATGMAISSSSMNRLLPTRIVWPSIWTVIP